MEIFLDRLDILPFSKCRSLSNDVDDRALAGCQLRGEGELENLAQAETALIKQSEQSLRGGIGFFFGQFLSQPRCGIFKLKMQF